MSEDKIYFSKVTKPEEFPDMRVINCGHPLIAKLVGRLLAWFHGGKFYDNPNIPWKKKK